MRSLAGGIVGDLFSVIVLDCLSWAGRKLQRVLCPQCEAESSAGVVNEDYNPFVCPRCGAHVQQFINANTHTINRDHSVVSAGLRDVTKQVAAEGVLTVRQTLSVVNSVRQPVVIQTRVGEPHSLPFFETHTGLIVPQHNRGHWKTHCQIPLRRFPRQNCEVVIESTVYNTWGDPLESSIGALNSLELFLQLIRLDLKLLTLDLKRLALELDHLESQRRQDDPRYQQVILTLTDHLLSR